MDKKEKTYLKLLGKKINDLRIEADIEMITFSSICDTSRSQLYMIESGKTNPRIVTLLKIAKALDISISELLSVDD